MTASLKRCGVALATAVLGQFCFMQMSEGATLSGAMIWGSVVFAFIAAEIIRSGGQS